MTGLATAPAARVLSPRSALRRYGLISALTWLPPGLMMSSMVLLMSARGLDLAEVGVVMSCYSVTVIVLELPTGGLADVLGRRAVLAAAALFMMAGMGLLAVAGSFWPFVAASVLKGIARALSSGPPQAWYVDTLHAAEGPDADLKPGLARGSAMSSASLCAGTLVGGTLPLVVPWGLAAPMVAASASAVALFVVVLVAMPEPPHPRPSLRSVLRDVPVTMAAGLRLGVADRGLRRLLFVAFTLGIALSSVEVLTPGRLAELTGDREWASFLYGLVTAAGFGASAAGSWIAPGVVRLLRGPVAAAIAGTAAGACALGGLAASAVLTGAAGVAAMIGAYVLMFAAGAVPELVRNEMMHRRVTTSRRATLMSVDSLQLQFGGTTATLGLGFLASRAGVGAGWAVVGVVVLASALLYLRVPPSGAHPE
ncbi:MFS transporter [Sphaerisporangium sp. NPDC051011]|uniref:MFS transporter n=1 Tax=Sphaerisporangium sp. NPDC051011 TaxID=3155792 RepID=UPI0033FB5272